MNKNNELINQILTDLNKDENINVSDMNVSELQSNNVNSENIINNQPSQPTDFNQQKDNIVDHNIPNISNKDVIQEIPNQINNNNSESNYNKYIYNIKDIILFVVIFFIVSLPQLNSIIIEFIPEDINIYILLLIKAILGSIIFCIINYFILQNLQ